MKTPVTVEALIRALNTKGIYAHNKLTTAKGDLITYDATKLGAYRLNVGADDRVLVADSTTDTGLAWKLVSAAGGAFGGDVDDLATATGNATEYVRVDGAGTGLEYRTATETLTDLGLVAGGAGDIWVEKAGDTMTGPLVIGWSTTSAIGLTINAPASQTGNLIEAYSTDLAYNVFAVDKVGALTIKHNNSSDTIIQAIQVGSGDSGGGDGDEIFSVRRNSASREVRLSGFDALSTTSNPQATTPGLLIGGGFNSASVNAELRVNQEGSLTTSPQTVATWRASTTGTAANNFGGSFTFYAERSDGGTASPPTYFQWGWKNATAGSLRSFYRWKLFEDIGGYNSFTAMEAYVDTNQDAVFEYYGGMDIAPTGTTQVPLTATSPAGSSVNMIEAYSTDLGANAFTLSDAGAAVFAGSVTSSGFFQSSNAYMYLRVVSNDGWVMDSVGNLAALSDEQIRLNPTSGVDTLASVSGDIIRVGGIYGNADTLTFHAGSTTALATLTTAAATIALPVSIVPTGTTQVPLTLTSPALSTVNIIEAYSTDLVGNAFTLDDAGKGVFAGQVDFLQFKTTGANDIWVGASGNALMRALSSSYVINYSRDWDAVLIYTAGNGLQVTHDSAGTADVVAAVNYFRTSSGTPTTGFGVDVKYWLEDDGGTNRAASYERIQWQSAVAATYNPTILSRIGHYTGEVDFRFVTYDEVEFRLPTAIAWTDTTAVGFTITTPTTQSVNAFEVISTDNGTLLGIGETAAVWTNINLQTDDFVSQTTGWQITQAGAADFRDMFADTLTVETFIAETLRAYNGAIFIPQVVTKLVSDFTSPASIGLTVSITVEDIPGSEGFAAFSDNDWVRMRFINRSSGLIVDDIWGQVATYVDNADATQSWTFTLRDGSTAITIETGAAVLGYGVSGDGYIEITSIASNSPYMDIATWATNPYTGGNISTHLRLGNVDGIGTFGAEWGLYAGVDATEQYVLITDTQVSAHGMDLTLYESGTARIKLDATGPYIGIGAAVPTAFSTGTGIWMGNDSGTYKFRVGDPAGTRLAWDGSTLVLYDANNAASITLAASGNASISGVLNVGTSGGIYQGTGTFASPTTGLKIWNDGGIGRLASYNTGVAQVYFDTSGLLIAGGGNVEIDATGIEVLESATARMRLDAAGTYFGIGAAVPTAFGTGTGIWMGLDAAAYKFRVGDPAGARVQWTGTNLSLYNGDNDLTLDFGATGNMSIAGVLNVGTSGGIYQGTGTFATPTTGLKIWNDGGVGRLATYSSGTAQVYFNTSGHLVAGAGAIIANAAGLNITAGTDDLPSNPDGTYTTTESVLRFNSGQAKMFYYKSTLDHSGTTLLSDALTGRTSGATHRTTIFHKGDSTTGGGTDTGEITMVMEGRNGVGGSHWWFVDMGGNYFAESGTHSLLLTDDGLWVEKGMVIGTEGATVYDNDLQIAGGLAVGNTSVNPTTGQILLYTGGVLEGDISVSATRLLFQQTSSNPTQFGSSVYVSGAIRAGSTVTVGTNDIGYHGNLRPYRNSTTYTGYVYVPLTTSITATTWNGGARSTAGPTLIDISAVFTTGGTYPAAGVKAIMAQVVLRDSGSGAATTITGLRLGPNTTATNAVDFACEGLPNDRWSREASIVNCDANGDVYFWTYATGTSTLDVFLRIQGYFI